MIKKAIEENVTSARDHIEKGLAKVTSEVSNGQTRMSFLEDRV